RVGRPRARPRAARARAHHDANPARPPGRVRAAGLELVERVSRFACVLVEHFDAAAIERCEPALRERPLAVVNPRVDRPDVGRHAAPQGVQTTRVMTTIEANAAAREHGVRPGMTETEARARCPILLTRPRVEEYVASAHHALLEAVLAVSPRIEDGGAGLAYVDTAGLERLIGDPAAIGRRLVHQVRAIGLIPRVGLAASRTGARMAAGDGPGAVTIRPPGPRARSCLSPLPPPLRISPQASAGGACGRSATWPRCLVKVSPRVWGLPASPLTIWRSVSTAIRSVPGRRRRSGKKRRASTGRSTRW